MYSQWVKAARANAGKSQEALAHELDVTKGNISAWENDRHKPDVGDLIEISLVTKYPVPDDIRSRIETALAIASGTERAGFAIPLLSNKASMGIGDDELAEDVIGGEIVLTRDFVDRLHPARAESLKFIHAYGDSMAPTLNSGDVLLVDTSVKDVKIDGIYVLKAHERLFVKRVRQRMDGQYEISSDNPTHKTVDVLNGDNQVSVIGRVVFYWNGRKVS